MTNLRPDDTDEDPFIYMLRVQCVSCRETHDKMVGVNRIVGFSSFLSVGCAGQGSADMGVGDEGDFGE